MLEFLILLYGRAKRMAAKTGLGGTTSLGSEVKTLASSAGYFPWSGTARGLSLCVSVLTKNNSSKQEQTGEVESYGRVARKH